MIFLKMIILILIFITSTLIGMMLSKKYVNRVKELREFKNALNMFGTKIKFTYEPIPSIFLEISEKITGNIGKIFQTAAEYMTETTADIAWKKALDTAYTNMKTTDIDTIMGLGRLLGTTDVEGQLSEIKLVDEFLNKQLEDAEFEKRKNEKMYRTLGIVSGLTITILLI